MSKTKAGKKIGIIYGGLPDERDYAVKSANDIEKALLTLGYKTVHIDFDKSILSNLKKHKIDLAFLVDATFIGNKQEYALLGNKSLRDILEENCIPYTASQKIAADTTKNKVSSKKAFIKAHLKTPAYKELTSDDSSKDEARIIISELGLPIIVKPRDEGSSLGIVVTRTYDELIDAIETRKREFTHVFVEQYLKGTEVTVSLLEEDGQVKALTIIEINHKSDYYSRAIKTTDFEMGNHGSAASEFHVPARLNQDLYSLVQKAAISAFKAVHASGYARVDIIISDGIPNILEINALPVLHSKDFVSWSARTCGIPYEQLIAKIVDTAWRNADGKTRYGKR